MAKLSKKIHTIVQSLIHHGNIVGHDVFEKYIKLRKNRNSVYPQLESFNSSDIDAIVLNSLCGNVDLQTCYPDFLLYMAVAYAKQPDLTPFQKFYDSLKIAANHGFELAQSALVIIDEQNLQGESIDGKAEEYNPDIELQNANQYLQSFIHETNVDSKQQRIEMIEENNKIHFLENDLHVKNIELSKATDDIYILKKQLSDKNKLLEELAMKVSLLESGSKALSDELKSTNASYINLQRQLIVTQRALTSLPQTTVPFYPISAMLQGSRGVFAAPQNQQASSAPPHDQSNRHPFKISKI